MTAQERAFAAAEAHSQAAGHWALLLGFVLVTSAVVYLVWQELPAQREARREAARRDVDLAMRSAASKNIDADLAVRGKAVR